MPVAAVAAIAVGVSVGAATLVGGLAIASGALSLAGQITGNKTLKTLGMVAGLASAGAGLIGGLGGAATAAAEAGGIADGAVMGAELADGAALAADAGTLTNTATAATDLGSGLYGMDIAGESAGLINSPTSIGDAASAMSGAPAVGTELAGTQPMIDAPTIRSNAAAQPAADATSNLSTTGVTDATTGAPGDPATGLAAEVGKQPPGILQQAKEWFGKLTPAEKIQYGNMLKGGLGTLAEFMGPKNAQTQAETDLIKAKTGLINSQQANANNIGQLKLGVTSNPAGTPFGNSIQNPIRFAPKGA